MAKKDKKAQDEQPTTEEFDFAGEGADEIGAFDLDGWEDIKPQQPSAEGQRELEIKSVKAVESKGTDNKPIRKGMMLVLNINDAPELQEDIRVRPIFHRMWFPLASDPEDKAAVMMEMLKETMDAFKYVPSVKGKIIPNELVGLKAQAMVSLVAPTPKNRLRAPQNEVARWLSGPNAPGVIDGPDSYLSGSDGMF